jgi:exonuclease SbcC
MRPLALRVENLTSFRGAHGPLAFDGLDLFAIAGPTGAGKSSLLDAMLLALYGEVPRTGKQLKELISLGKDQLVVSLDFVRGGEAYRVTRRLFRNTKATQAQLERLGRSDGALSAEPEALAEGVNEVNQRIAQLLGLDLNAFTQSVILPQGEFARFLKSTPKDRQKILGTLLQLLVYERMRKRATSEAGELEAAAAMLERTLVEDALVTPEAVAALREQHARQLAASAALEPRLHAAEAATVAAEARVRLLREQDDLKRQQGELERQRAQVAADEARLDAARRAAGVVPRLEQADAARRESERLAAAAQRARTAADQARAAVEARRRAGESALAEAARLPELDARIEALGQAVVLAGPTAAAARAAREAEALATEKKQAVARLRKDKAARSEAATEAERAAQEAGSALERAAQELAAAETALRAAELARREGEKRDAVAHLRHGLAKGDPCPVCERALTKAPPALAGSDLGEREAAETRAREARDAARARVDTARQEAERKRSAHDRAALALETATREVERASAEALEADERAGAARAAHAERIAELRALTDEADPAAAQAALRGERQRIDAARAAAQEALAAADNALAGAAATATAAEAAAADAQAKAGQAEQEAKQAAAEAQFASPEAARAAALPPAEQQRLAEAIRAWSAKLQAGTERLAALAEQVAVLPPGPAALADAEAALASARHERDALRTLREQGVREAARLEEQVAALEARLAAVAKRRAELESKRAQLSLLRQLALELKADRFQAYLLHETVRDLVAGASLRLLELSAGRYALEYVDDDFHVRDNDNAGERRRADTLSGGETFLASLALALELSQQVQKAAGAVHLDSLFIDEGFGTLDPETLETVQEAIESLPTGGRMVGVITHLAELTARLPARVVVEKGPAGSSFRVEVA